MNRIRSSLVPRGVEVQEAWKIFCETRGVETRWERRKRERENKRRKRLPGASPWAKERRGPPPRRFRGRSGCRSALLSACSRWTRSQAVGTRSRPGNTWSSVDSWGYSSLGAIKSRPERSPPSPDGTAILVTIWKSRERREKLFLAGWKYTRSSMVCVRIVVVTIVMHLVCSIIGKINFNLIEIHKIHETSL